MLRFHFFAAHNFLFSAKKYMLKLFLKRASEVNGKTHLIVLLQLIYLTDPMKESSCRSQINNNSHSRCWFIGCNQLNCCLPSLVKFYVILIVYSFLSSRSLSAFVNKLCDCCQYDESAYTKYYDIITVLNKPIKWMRMEKKEHTIDNRLFSLSLSCSALNRLVIFINSHLHHLPLLSFFFNS